MFMQLKAAIGSIKMILGTAVLVLIIGLGALCNHLYKEVKQKELQNATLELIVKQSTLVINNLKTSLENAQVDVLAYDKQLNKIKENNSAKRSSIKRARTKEALLHTKPNDMLNRINAATDRMFKSIACSSGNPTSCKDPSANAKSDKAP